jgi:hypothetical protein
MHTIAELGLCIRHDGYSILTAKAAIVRTSGDQSKLGHLVDAGRGRTEPQIQSRGNGSRKRLF